MFLVLALLAVLLGPAASDFLRIDPYWKECILEFVPLYSKIRFYFEVVEGGFLDIGVEIAGPDNRVLIQGDRESCGNYTFAADMDGGYTFCCRNKMSAQIEKIVMVTTDISEAPERKKKETEGAAGAAATNVAGAAGGALLGALISLF